MKKIFIVSFFVGFYLSSTYVHATPGLNGFLIQGGESNSLAAPNNRKVQHLTIKVQSRILEDELSRLAQKKAQQCLALNDRNLEDETTLSLETPLATCTQCNDSHKDVDALLEELLNPKISAPSPFTDYKKEIEEWKKEDAQMKYGYSLSGTEAFKQALEKIGLIFDELENRLDNIEKDVSDLKKEKELRIFFAKFFTGINELLEESDDQDYDVPKPLKNIFWEGARTFAQDLQNIVWPQSPSKPVSRNQDYDVPKPPRPVSKNQDYDVPKPPRPVSRNQDYDGPQSLPNNTSSKKTQNSHSKLNQGKTHKATTLEISSPLNPKKNGHYIEQGPALKIEEIAVPKQQSGFKHVAKKLFKRFTIFSKKKPVNDLGKNSYVSYDRVDEHITETETGSSSPSKI